MELGQISLKIDKLRDDISYSWKQRIQICWDLLESSAADPLIPKSTLVRSAGGAVSERGCL